MDSNLLRDELPYGPELRPGVMLLHRPPARHHRMQRQYALSMLFDVHPLNIDLADDRTADQLARRWANLLRSLPPGSVVDVRLDSSPGETAPDWEAARASLHGEHLDWQRRHLGSGMVHTQRGRRYRLRQNRVSIGLRCPSEVLLPTSVAQVLQTAFIWRSREVQAHFDRQVSAHLGKALDGFAERARAFATAMADLGLKPVRLEGAALLNRLAAQLDPAAPILPFEPGVPLRDQMGTIPVTLSADGCQMGNRHASVLQPHRGIGRTFPGMLSAPRSPEGTDIALDLASVAGDSHYSISVVTAIPDTGTVINSLQSRQSFAWVQRLGGRGQVRADVDAQAAELSDLLALVTSGQDSLLPTGVRIVAWDDDQTTSTASAMVDRLTTLGITSCIETYIGNTLFLQSLSLGTDAHYPAGTVMGGMLSIPGIHTANLTPIWGGFQGPGESSKAGTLFLNRLGDPVLFDPFDGPGSPHGVIVGVTRSGKSALTNTMLHQIVPTGGYAFILDRYGSYERLCEIHDGVHYRMDLDKPICLGLMDGPLDASHRSTILAALVEMCGSGGASDALDRAEHAILTTLLKQWAGSQRPGAPRTLSHFVESFDALAPHIKGAEPLCDRLRLLLMPYYGDGEFAAFVDGPNQLEIGAKRLVSVDIAGLREMREIEAVMVALFFLRFGAIVRDPALLHTPKFMIADEVAFLLQSPATAKFFITLSRALARFRCSLITITQLLSDFDGPVGQTIARMAGFRMMFRLPSSELAAITGHGLGPKHAELILTLERSTDSATALISTKNGDEGVIRIVAPPEFITAIGQDPIHMQQREAALCQA
jgi:hypothetical protein